MAVSHQRLPSREKVLRKLLDLQGCPPPVTRLVRSKAQEIKPAWKRASVGERGASDGAQMQKKVQRGGLSRRNTETIAPVSETLESTAKIQ